MKILNTTPMHGRALQKAFQAKASGIHFTIADAHRLPEDELMAAIADADLVLGDYSGGTPITRRVVSAAKQLKFIQQPSAGYNHIDVNACRDAGIPVANTPGANDSSVAEHTIMLILACLRKLTYFNAKTHEAEWLFDRRREVGTFDLGGKTVGLLGMGRTAQAVASRLAPFGVTLLYHSRARMNPADEKQYQATYASLEEILTVCDIVSIHLPLTQETEGIITADRLALMKPTAILINVGRGPLVDETALAEAVRSKKLSAAATDVFSKEPPPKDHPLFGVENVILTPHLAGSTLEAGTRVIGMATDNLARVLKGEKPLWLVNA